MADPSTLSSEETNDDHQSPVCEAEELIRNSPCSRHSSRSPSPASKEEDGSGSGDVGAAVDGRDRSKLPVGESCPEEVGTELEMEADSSEPPETTLNPSSVEEKATTGSRRESLNPDAASRASQEREPATAVRRTSNDSSLSLSLSSSSSNHEIESGTIGIGSYYSDTSLTLSQQQAIGNTISSRDVSFSSQQAPEGGQPSEPIAEELDDDERPTCGSPFLLVKKSDVTDMSQFESPGLLYARSNKKNERDLYQSRVEVAEDVLEALKDTVHEEVASVRPVLMREEGGGKSEDTDKSVQRVPAAASPVHIAAVPKYRVRQTPPPMDPGVLLQLERDAQKLAASLSHTMDNLRNSLHAMTVCSRQSVELHKESLENLQQTVDANIKAMYTFMAKFDELNRNTRPMLEIAAQISEINETLRILEKQFKVP